MQAVIQVLSAGGNAGGLDLGGGEFRWQFRCRFFIHSLRGNTSIMLQWVV
jgi:hypothetical protein